MALYTLNAPLCLHVCYDEAIDKIGFDLMSFLYDSYCRDYRDPQKRKIGIPIYYWTPTQRDLFLKTLHSNPFSDHMIFYLIDNNVVVDKKGDWKRLFEKIRRGPRSRLIKRWYELPFTIARHATKCSFFNEINYFRGDFQHSRVRFLMELTHIILRYFKAAPDLRNWILENCSTGIPLFSEYKNAVSKFEKWNLMEPTQVFLSHAKKDFGREAKEIEWITKQIHGSSLNAFFDATCIPAGSDFMSVLRDKASSCSMIVFVGDHYSSRPICLAELFKAKEYERPVVVVMVMQNYTSRLSPYLGNCPTFQWRMNESEANRGKQLDNILLAVLFEELNFLYNQRYFEMLKQPRGTKRHAAYHTIFSTVDRFLASPPELFQLTMSSWKTTDEVVLYPDPPVNPLEIEVLEGKKIDGVSATKRKFVTLSEVYGREMEEYHSDYRYILNKKIIGLSLSNPSEEDLRQRALLAKHVQDALNEIARYLLAARAHLAYGGMINFKNPDDPMDEGFTIRLAGIIQEYVDAEIVDPKTEEKPKNKTKVQPIRNYQFYPTYLDNTAEQLAALKPYLEVIQVPPPRNLWEKYGPPPIEKLQIPRIPSLEQELRLAALREMRILMSKENHAQVFLGGKRFGYSGPVPGIWEEFFLNLREKKPIYLLAGFGGCTADIAEALSRSISNDEEDYKRFVADRLKIYYPNKTGYQKDMEMLQENILNLYEVGWAALNNGLSFEENETLRQSCLLPDIIHLLLYGLKTSISR